MIAHLDEITAQWLAQVLDLPPTSIIGLEKRPNSAFNSSLAHLTVTYHPQAPASAPKHLVIKLNGHEDGFEEIAFYRTIMALPDVERLPMLVRCYAAESDKNSGNSYCLLQDVSESHQPATSRQELIDGTGVPRADHLELVVDAVARFHAYWWQHPRLGQGMAAVRWWYSDELAFEKRVTRRKGEWAKFKAAVGETFPADLIDLYEQTLARLPHLWEAYLKARVLPLKHITLSNGDCYLSQFLVPKDTQQGGAYLVDFQDVSANFGPYDLVYMLATFWTSAQRHEQKREELLLRRYHTTLQAYGVGDYAWEDLMFDYQMMTVFMIFDPIWNQTSGSVKTYWWPKVQRLTDSFRTLKCEEALESLSGK